MRYEMDCKSEYRQEVLGKSSQLLITETKNNEEARSAMSVRRRKVDRARRKLERLKSENRSVKNQIESQATKLRNQELEKDTLMNLFCLMRIKDCLQVKTEWRDEDNGLNSSAFAELRAVFS